MRAARNGTATRALLPPDPGRGNERTSSRSPHLASLPVSAAYRVAYKSISGNNPVKKHKYPISRTPKDEDVKELN